MTLWLVRHARPLISPGVCYGRHDVAAEGEETRLAATALVTALEAASPCGLRVVCSPLKRCGQLAQALHTLRPDWQLDTDPRLSEMDFGQWENVAWSDIPRAAMDAWTDDFGAHRFGGAESANEVLARVASAYHEVAGDTLWITHAGVMRAASLVARGVYQVDKATQWPVNAPGYGQWFCL